MPETKQEKKKIKFTTIMVLLIIFEMIVFTGIMIHLFCTYGHTPDTLIISFFGACGTELSLCGFVQNSGNKYDYMAYTNNNSTGGVG